jgi:hypothetical protein
MTDKREWRRINVDWPAECRGGALSGPLKCVVINANPGGLCFSAGVGFEPGMAFMMAVDLPGETAILEAVVAWSGYIQSEGIFRTGVSIDKTPESDRNVYLRHYNARLALSFRAS